MPAQLKVLYLNTAKRRQCHWSLIRDEQTASYRNSMYRRSWSRMFMRNQITIGQRCRQTRCGRCSRSEHRKGEARSAFRAALWVSRNHRAQAVPIPSHDMVAAAVSTRGEVLLLVAAYDVKSGSTGDFDDEQRRGILRHVTRGTVINLVGLLVCADFNRYHHHVLWGGTRATIEPGRSNEADGIIDFMQQNAMSSLLPSGTMT